MATETIEAVWKGGKIIPLNDIEVADETRVFVTLPVKEKKKSTLLSLAGVWKNYRTPDGKNIDDVKREIYDGRKISLRKEVAL